MGTYSVSLTNYLLLKPFQATKDYFFWETAQNKLTVQSSNPLYEKLTSIHVVSDDEDEVGYVNIAEPGEIRKEYETMAKMVRLKFYQTKSAP